jgi:type I restriction enzyme S subunit
MTKNDTNKLVRKFIIDNCKIIKIVEVDKGIFKHTNIKTKVLILKKEKTPDYNYEIDYLNINKKYEVKLIQKFKLNEDYHLSIKTNYEDLIINNKDIEIKTLGEVCDIDYGTRIVKNNNIEGEFPVYGSGRATFTTNTYNREGYNILIGRFALSEECVRFIKNKIFLNDSGLTVKPKTDIILHKYIGYYLLHNQSIIYNCARGSAQKNLDINEFKNIKIPIPSLEIQERLIKEIEDIDILINLRKNANENLKKEKEYLKKMINNKIINSNINEFGEIFDLIKGTIQSSKVEEDITSDIFFISKSEITDETRKIKYKYYNTNALYIAYAFNGNGKCPIRYYENKSIHSDLLYHIKPKKDLIDKINIIYIYYYLLNKKEYIEEKYQKGLAQKHLDVENFNKFKIYIPSLEIQEQFIKDIEELNIKFDKLKEDNDYIINNFEEYKKELFKF